MLRLCVMVLTSALCLHVTASLAQIYRWTDEAGRVHFTDNPGSIPADRRDKTRLLAPDTSGSTAPSAGASPPPATAVSPSPATPASDQTPSLRQRVQALQDQIEATQQERQQYIEKLKNVRDVQTNPAFGRQRRQPDEWGRALAEVERKLDALQTELQQVRSQLQSVEQKQSPSASSPRPSATVTADKQGHDRAYWEGRLDPIRSRLQKAEEQRRTLLEQLAAEQQERRTYGRRGEEVLRLTKALEQVEQERREADAALQALRQEAQQAGAPAEWVQ